MPREVSVKKCVVLFSGGIDSTTALYWARARYDGVTALSFDYGQRHKVELAMARHLTRRLRLSHSILKVDLRQIGGSALTDRRIALPEVRSADEIGAGLPASYVPFRNGIFLSLAAAWAEVNAVPDIICGFNTLDSPNYPDTRGPFVRAMERAVRLGTGAAARGLPLRILAPFVRLKKSAIIEIGLALGADYSYSISCYGGKEAPCAKCSACQIRRRAWREAGSRDHLLQRLSKEGQR
jgi:7-cyano-7-deazaguanine synthase